jgi:thiol-disulfide isomerase/thioredoxin
MKTLSLFVAMLLCALGASSKNMASHAALKKQSTITYTDTAYIKLPSDITGNWFKTDGSRQWILGLYAEKAIYQSKAWDYAGIGMKGSIVSISLKSGSEKKVLLLNAVKNGELTTAGDKAGVLTNIPSLKKQADKNDEGFTSAIYKSGIAIYSGYIKGYSTSQGFKTGEVITNNTITGEQENYVFNVNADGTFYIELPLAYARESVISLPFFHAYVYLEPGKQVFQEFDISGNSMQFFFMGGNAAVNKGLVNTFPLMRDDYDKIDKDIANFTPQQYQAYFFNIRDKKLALLDSLLKTNDLNKKSYALTKMGVTYNTAFTLLLYNSYKNQSYHKLNNIPFTSNKPLVAPLKLDSAYLSCLRYVKVNDPLAVVSFSYSGFINQLKNADIMLPLFNQARAALYIGELNKKKTLSNDEKEVLSNLKIVLRSDSNMAISMPTPIHTDLINGKEDYYKPEEEKFIRKRRAQILQNIWGTNMSFDLDVMDAQDVCNKITEQFIPLTAVQLAAIKPRYSNVIVYSVIEKHNDAIKLKIAQNKLAKIGSTKNKTPKTAADSVFEAIIKKYKGKAIYVDFWATWCSPCLEGILKVAPIKEDLKNENIVFVYITNPSSPIGLYNNKIPGIKGEHFRVTQDEWNVLSGKFNISGIPHYVLVNKQGAVIDPKMKWMEGEELKNRLLQVAKE